MSLSPGVHIGPYEVTAQIGVGGMGEVYRATDTKLKRDVALKVLPAALAADPERLARFQREAEVLASLNDPHIGAIHGVEESATSGSSMLREFSRRTTRRIEAVTASPAEAGPGNQPTLKLAISRL